MAVMHRTLPAGEAGESTPSIVNPLGRDSNNSYDELQRGLQYNQWHLTFSQWATQIEFLAFLWRQTVAQRCVTYVLVIILCAIDLTRLHDAAYVPLVVLVLPTAAAVAALGLSVCVHFCSPRAILAPLWVGVCIALGACITLAQYTCTGTCAEYVEHHDIRLGAALLAVTLGTEMPLVPTMVLTTAAWSLHAAQTTLLQHDDWGGNAHLFMLIGFIWVCSFFTNRAQIRLFVEERERVHEHRRAQALWARNNEVAQAEQQAKVHAEFLSIMAHELRTPLNAVIGASSLLRGAQLSVDQKECVDLVYTGAQCTLEVVNNILDFSSLKAGKIAHRPARTTPRALLHAVRRVLKPLADKNGIIIAESAVAAATDREVLLDGPRVEQVLRNFGSNAVNVMPAGGTLTVALQEAATPSVGSDTLRFEVTDTGPGLPHAYLKRVFEPFVRVNDTYGGAGLGLCISTELAAIMGGRVWAENRTGLGARFVLETPAYGAPPVTMEAVAPPPGTSGPGGSDSPRGGGGSPSAAHLPRWPSVAEIEGKKVLVFEDQPLNQRIIKKLVSKCGYQCDIAADGQIGLQIYTKRPSDYFAVLMDCQMPVMDGYAATGEIRRFEAETRHRRVPIVALTAEALAGDKRKCLQAGMDDYLTKPVELVVLDTVLRRLSRGG